MKVETKEEVISREYVEMSRKLRETIKAYAKTACDVRQQLLVQHMQIANSVVSRLVSNQYI